MRSRIERARTGSSPERLRVVGRDVAGRDRVDVDAVGSPLVGERLRQPGERRLGRGVGGDVDAALEAEQRGGEHDLPGAAPDHLATDPPGEDELARQVHRQHAVPLLVAVVHGRGALDRAGVVHEDVDRPLGAAQRLGEVGDRRPVGRSRPGTR
jgi:hypothetical protein